MKNGSFPVEAQGKEGEVRTSHWSYTRIDVHNIEVLPVEPWQPAVDVYEMDTELIFVMELAGVDPDVVRARLSGQHLTITGRRTSPIPAGVHRVHRIEIGHGPFERRFRLPVSCAPSLQSRFVGGYFVVTLTKRRS